MNHHKLHWLEKLQIEVGVLAAVVAVYFLLWPLVRPGDPDNAVTFLVDGRLAQLGVFAAALLTLAAVAGLVFVTCRPEAAMLVAFIGIGGVSLRSVSWQQVIWLHPQAGSGVFGRLALETGVLSLLAILAIIVVMAVRRAVGLARPGWLWQRPEVQPPQSGASKRPGAGQKPPADHELARQTLSCLGLALVLTAAVVSLLMQSDDRAQVIFAILIGSMVAMLAAHQFFPSPLAGLGAWLAPALVPLAFYLLARSQPLAAEPQSWINVGMYARALPIDWMTFGTGGGLLGYWFSARIHESRHWQKLERERQEDHG